MLWRLGHRSVCARRDRSRYRRPHRGSGFDLQLIAAHVKLDLGMGFGHHRVDWFIVDIASTKWARLCCFTSRKVRSASLTPCAAA